MNLPNLPGFERLSFDTELKSFNGIMSLFFNSSDSIKASGKKVVAKSPLTPVDPIYAAGALAFTKQSIEQTSSYNAYLGGKSKRLEKSAKALEFDIVKAMGFQTSIANTDLAKEIAAETMGRIQAESVVLLQTQGLLAASRALELLRAE